MTHYSRLPVLRACVHFFEHFYRFPNTAETQGKADRLCIRLAYSRTFNLHAVLGWPRNLLPTSVHSTANRKNAKIWTENSSVANPEWFIPDTHPALKFPCSGSRSRQKFRIHADPDPTQIILVYLEIYSIKKKILRTICPSLFHTTVLQYTESRIHGPKMRNNIFLDLLFHF